MARVGFAASGYMREAGNAVIKNCAICFVDHAADARAARIQQMYQFPADRFAQGLHSIDAEGPRFAGRVWVFIHQPFEEQRLRTTDWFRLAHLFSLVGFQAPLGGVGAGVGDRASLLLVVPLDFGVVESHGLLWLSTPTAAYRDG